MTPWQQACTCIPFNLFMEAVMHQTVSFLQMHATTMACVCACVFVVVCLVSSLLL
eukprot:m.98040 g.98040  ORF g.98040 m.98040 type:complete len:55 (+) comp13115_c0_seq10:985-1149(+)